MKFIIIKAKERTVELVDCETLKDAQELAGLDKVDHGTISRDKDGGYSIVVYEFALFVPAERQHYFALGGRLYGGNAVIYAFDAAGETIDVVAVAKPHFFRDQSDVEHAIALRLIARPETSMNGELIWRWPAPPPDGFNFPPRESMR